MTEIVREMLISHDSLETRVAIVEDRRIAELYVERPRRGSVGNIYLGTVRDVLPGMQAAFVDIGLERNAFLYVDDVVSPEALGKQARGGIQTLLKPGQDLVVQVLKDPMGSKGARVTTEITLPGRLLVLMPTTSFIGISRKLPAEERERLTSVIEPLVPEGVGVIVRTAAVGATAKDLQADLEFLLRLWDRVKSEATTAVAPAMVYVELDLALRMVRDAFSEEYRRLVVDDKRVHEKVLGFLKTSAPRLAKRVQLYRDAQPLFEAYALRPDVELALRRTVPLPSGGHITIDRTEALTAIDVNTGSYVGRTNLEDTVVRTNLEAAAEAARQVRLRDIGGIIVIDFIDMEVAANRERVVQRLASALERDRTRTRISDMSRLGLVEITRKNVTDGLYRVLTTACPTCRGTGRVISDETRRIATERALRAILRDGRSAAYLLAVNPETYPLLENSDRQVSSILRGETGKQLRLIADPDVGPTEVRVLMEGRAGTVGL